MDSIEKLAGMFGNKEYGNMLRHMYVAGLGDKCKLFRLL